MNLRTIYAKKMTYFKLKRNLTSTDCSSLRKLTRSAAKRNRARVSCSWHKTHSFISKIITQSVMASNNIKMELVDQGRVMRNLKRY